MAYGKYKETVIHGELGTAWRVEIWKQDYSGSITDFNLQGEGFEVTWNGSGGTRDRTFLASECKLNYLVENQADETWLYGTFVNGYEDCFIRIYKSKSDLGTLTNSSDVSVLGTPLLDQKFTKASNLTLDGVDDYIDFGGLIFDDATVWTVAITITDFDDVSSTNQSFLFGYTTEKNIGLRSTQNNKVFFRSNTGAFYEFDYQITDAAPRRMVWASNGTTISLYVNGALVDTITPNSTQIILKYIGAGYWNAGVPNHFVTATISEFQAWSTAWNQTNVNFDFANPASLPSSTSGLITYLKLNESEGTAVYDSSGNGNSGSLIGDAHWEPIIDPIGLHALKFDGVNDYVDFGNEIIASATVWTVAVTIQDYEPTTYAWLLGGSSMPRNIGLNASHLNNKVFYRSNSYTYYEFDYQITDAATHRCVWASNGTTISLYVNGSLVDTITPDSTNLLLRYIGAGYWASGGGTNYFVKATLSNFQAWSSEWTAAAVLYDYNYPGRLITDNSSSNINADTLIARLLMNNGSGSVLYDSSQNTNNATIYGATWDVSNQQATFGTGNRNIVHTSGDGELRITAIAAGLPAVWSGGYGNNLITNGDFANGDISGWGLMSDATNTTNGTSDYADITSSSYSNNLIILETPITTTVGQEYTVSFERIAGTDNMACYAATSPETITTYIATAGVDTLTFTATADTTYIGFRGGSSDYRCLFDNVSVKSQFWGTGTYSQLTISAGLTLSQARFYGLDSGEKYKVTFTVSLTGSGSTVAVHDTVSGTVTITASGTYTYIITGAEQLLLLHIQTATSNEVWYLDDVLIEQVTGTYDLWWYGWMQPSFDRIENASLPYQFQVTFTDSYGYFGKKKVDKFADETAKRNPHRIKEILITDFGDEMKIHESDVAELDDTAPVPPFSQWLRTSIDWWRPEDTYQIQDPLHLYYVAKGAFAARTQLNDDGSTDLSNNPFEYKQSNVFSGVLKTFNTVGFLAEGFYNFIQPNNYADNTTGDIRAYDYGYISNTPTGGTLNTLLTIDQSNHAILAGSTILFEPSFESVKAKFTQINSSFNISSGQDLTTSILAGAMQSNTGVLTLEFEAKHIEKIAESSFSFNAPYGNPQADFEIIDASFLTTAELTISITDGSTTYYLTETADDNTLGWTTTAGSISIYRGYGAGAYDTPINSTSGMCVGLLSDPTPTNASATSGGPCNTHNNSITNIYTFTTFIKFQASVEAPPITGEVSIQLTASNNYYQAHNQQSGSFPFDYTVTIEPITNPTPTTDTTTALSIILTPTEENELNDSSNGITYTSEQTENKAWENYDLGNFNLGQTGIDKLYSVQYYDSSDSQYKAATGGFQRGNPSPDEPRNILQLLTKEFLELQVSPLEILQASIRSNDISPLKLIKYSLNADNNYKYYLFLGGTFRAGSEIMSGEWYRVNSSTSYITEPDPMPDSPVFLTTGPSALTHTIKINKTNALEQSYGVTTATIASGVAQTKISLAANTKGKIISGQKLIFTYPDGSNPYNLTAADDYSTGTQIDMTGFTTTIDYPAGSVLRPLAYDFSNVLQTKGHNIGAIYDNSIYLTPSDLIKISTSNHFYVEQMIPDGYKITKVALYGSSNDAFSVYHASYNAATQTLVDSGTINSELTLSSAITPGAGKYCYLISMPSSGVTMYGGKITLEEYSSGA